jgi:serine/threonine-protein kinase
MEWLRGATLRQRAERTPLSYAETCDVLLAITNALGAAHAVGIVHRDLKPDNVFLVDVKDSPSPLVKLLDFGIAKLLVDDRRINQTAAGVFMGTPGYTSPEQARGDEVDPRTDLYALGVIAFELLTGQLPFRGNSATDVIAKHIYEPAPSVAPLAPGAPAELAALVQALLAKDPAARPPIDDVRARLRGIASEAAMLTVRAPVAAPAPFTEQLSVAPPARHRRATAAAVALGVAALVVATIVIATRVTGGHEDAAAGRDGAAAPARELAAPPAPVPVPAPAPIVPVVEPVIDAAVPAETQAAGPGSADPRPDAVAPPPKPKGKAPTMKRGKKSPGLPPTTPDRDGLL